MLRDNAGRPVVVEPPVSVGGAPIVGVVARYTSAEDVAYDTDGGPITRRELTVQVEIGPGPGQLVRVEKGWRFLIDVDDGDGQQPWTVESIANADAGWRRCRCVQEIQTGGRRGLPRPNR